MLNDFLNDLRNNPRLRLWLALILVVIWLYGLLTLREALQSAEQQQSSIARGVTRLRAQLTHPEWVQRVAPAKTLAVQMESRLWQAQTAGLAQAALQDWLNTALAHAKVTRPQITVSVIDEAGSAGGDGSAPTTSPASSVSVDGAPATPPDLWKIKAKLGFDFTAPTLLEFLNRIENHDKQIIVSSLKVQKEPMSHVEVELLAYFQKQAATDKTRPATKDTAVVDRPAPASVKP